MSRPASGSGGTRARPGVAVRVAAAVVAGGAGAVLAGRAVHGAAVTHATGGGPVLFGAGPWWVVVVGVLLLAGTGALPAWRLAGARPLAVFLAPCLGAGVAGISAAVTVVGPSEPLRWYVAFAAALNAAALASTAAGRGRRLRPRSASVAVFLPVATACGYGISAMGRVAPAASARRTWLSLAPMLVRGHRAVTHALAPSSGTAVHLLASPLAGGIASVTWLVTGSRSAPAAAGVLAVVSAAAVGAAACAIAEVGVAVAGQATGAGAGAPDAGSCGRAVALTATGAAIAWCLVAMGVGGHGALAGEPTLLGMSSVAALCVLTLVLPPTAWRLRAAAALAVVAVLAGPVSTVATGAAVVAVGARRWLGGPDRARGPQRVVGAVGAVVALGAVATWPVVAAFVGAGPPSTALPPPGASARMQAAWDALAPMLWPAVAAAVVAVVGTVAVGRWRRRRGLPSDLGLVVVGGTGVVVVVVARGWGTPLTLPLRAVPAAAGADLMVLLAAAAVAVWATVATAVAVAGPAARAELAGARGALGVDVQVERRAISRAVPAGAGDAGGSVAGGSVAGSAVVGGSDRMAAHRSGRARAPVGVGRPGELASGEVDGWTPDVLHPSA